METILYLIKYIRKGKDSIITQFQQPFTNRNQRIRRCELLVPFYHIFGFMNSYERLMMSMPMMFEFMRNNTTNSLFFGNSGQDASFQIEQLEVMTKQVVPEDNFKYEFNETTARPIEVGFMSPLIQQFPIVQGQWTLISIFPASDSEPNFVFIIFEDQYWPYGQILQMVLQLTADYFHNITHL